MNKRTDCTLPGTVPVPSTSMCILPFSGELKVIPVGTVRYRTVSCRYVVSFVKGKSWHLLYYVSVMYHDISTVLNTFAPKYQYQYQYLVPVENKWWYQVWHSCRRTGLKINFCSMFGPICEFFSLFCRSNSQSLLLLLFYLNLVDNLGFRFHGLVDKMSRREGIQLTIVCSSA